MSTSGGNANVRANVSVTSINCTSTTSSAMPQSTTAPSLPASAPPTTTFPLTDGASTLTSPSHCSSISGSNNNNAPADPSAPSNGNHIYGGNGSIRISVPKMEESDESDTELSNIESTAAAVAAAVNLRTSINKAAAPRPMSWEGELSDHEDRMETESATSPVSVADGKGKIDVRLKEAMDHVNVITYATNGTAPSQGHRRSQSQEPVKPEVADAKRYPIDMSSVKYEVQQASQQYQQLQADNVNSPLLARSKTSLLPANPSPDSAIHSVYTHSSPSQSPLTSRHTPYTPSLSRNNSDASYSSCYSYSSEFSPTHSPIQGRHNMYSGNFNGSPLHHALYKPMMDGVNGATIGASSAANVPPHAPHTPEEGQFEAEPIPSAGISRQQLINR